MNRTTRITLIITACLIAFLVAGSLITESQRFPYGYVTIGCVFASALAGFLVGRQTAPGIGAAAGGFVSLAGPIVAWFILASLPPWHGAVPQARPGPVVEVMAILAIGGTVAGLVGGWLGRRGA